MKRPKLKIIKPRITIKDPDDMQDLKDMFDLAYGHFDERGRLHGYIEEDVSTVVDRRFDSD